MLFLAFLRSGTTLHPDYLNVLIECRSNTYPVQRHVPLYTRKTISLPGNRQVNLPVEIQSSLNDNATLLVLGKGGIHKIEHWDTNSFRDCYF